MAGSLYHTLANNIPTMAVILWMQMPWPYHESEYLHQTMVKKERLRFWRSRQTNECRWEMVPLGREKVISGSISQSYMTTGKRRDSVYIGWLAPNRKASQRMMPAHMNTSSQVPLYSTLLLLLLLQSCTFLTLHRTKSKILCHKIYFRTMR